MSAFITVTTITAITAATAVTAITVTAAVIISGLLFWLLVGRSDLSYG